MELSAGHVLEVRDVFKSYGKLRVLKGASLTVDAGEVVGVVGENGSGKSTLMKVLVGLLPADSGQVRLKGTLGYCPQALELYERLTVREHLRYFGAAYGLSDEGAATAGQRYVGLLKFARYMDTKVSALSEGTKQKLNLTLALMHSPSLLLLDEPYQGFDWETFRAFVGLLGELRAARKSVLLISHLITSDIGADRVLTLRDGAFSE